MQKVRKNFVFLGLILLVAVLAAGFYTMIGAANAADKNRPVATIRGRVVSNYGPVENARVRIIGEESYTLTDRQGRYELQTAHSSGQRGIVTAGKEGWFNNGQIAKFSGRTRDTFLNPVYLDDRADYRFISPVTCARCHIKLTRYYDQSKMAHTTSNPKLLNMYYGTDAFNRQGVGPGYKLDNPNSEGNCTTCHAPSAAGSIPASQDLKNVLGSPMTEWDGISCDYCHKVRKVIKDKTKPSQRSSIRGSFVPCATVSLKSWRAAKSGTAVKFIQLPNGKHLV
jgi:hypothetical protein